MGKTRVSSNDNDVEDNENNGEDGELKAFNETSAIY